MFYITERTNHISQMTQSNTQISGIKKQSLLFIGSVVFLFIGFAGCGTKDKNHIPIMLMKEKQISYTDKNHVLDNNDNFSPDDQYLCYDTRGTVFNDNIGNSKTIEKIEISTGIETVLYQPESISGEEAAPGVGAVSWHPSDNKVVFIHGPNLEEVKERGYYGITNRTGVEVSADGKEVVTKVDRRDVATDRPTIPGAQRGGTHRHEYSRNGKRIGFTYDDFLNPNYDRTIGYMEINSNAPEGYSHYFAVILKPAEKGKSKPGEIEKAYGDSWVDPTGTMRAFIGKVRAENGVDYQTDLFVADIPQKVDITSGYSGNGNKYPEPPVGINIRRLTHSGEVGGIVRGSFDGQLVAYLSPDDKGVLQIFVTKAHDTDVTSDQAPQPQQLSTFHSDASALRWHPGKNWLFALSNGNIAVICAEPGPDYGKTIMLTADAEERSHLVASHGGDKLAYTIERKGEGENHTREFKQIFLLELDWAGIQKSIK